MPEIDLSTEQRSIRIQPERISRNSFWILLGLVGSSLLSFVTLFVLTRYLGPEHFGTYSIAMSMALVFLPLADLGLDLHLTRRIAAAPQSLRHELANTLSAKCFLLAGFWALTMVTASLLQYPPATMLYISLFLASFLFATLTQSFVSALRAIQKMRFESLSLFAGRLTGLAAVFAGILLGGGLMTLIAAHLLGSLVYLLTAVLFLRSQIQVFRFRFSLDGFRARIRQGLPFGLTAAFVAVYQRVDTLILSKMTGEDTVGFYNGACNLILASTLLSTALVVALFPVLSSTFEKQHEQAQEIFQKGLKFSILLGVPLGIGCMLMAGPLVRLAYGAEFETSTGILQIMATSIPFIYVTGVVGNSMGAVGFQNRVCRVTLVCMVFNLAVNLLVIPKFGAAGAAATRAATELLRAVQLWILLGGIFRRSAGYAIVGVCLCSLVAWGSFVLLQGRLGMWGAAAAFALVYALAVLAFRLLDFDDLARLVKPSAERP